MQGNKCVSFRQQRKWASLNCSHFFGICGWIWIIEVHFKRRDIVLEIDCITCTTRTNGYSSQDVRGCIWIILWLVIIDYRLHESKEPELNCIFILTLIKSFILWPSNRDKHDPKKCTYMFHVYCMFAGSNMEQSILWPSQIKTVYLSISRHHTFLWRKPIIRLSHRFDLQFADIAGLQQCYRWPFRVWVSRWMHLKSCCSLLLRGKKALLWKGCQSIDSNNSSPQLLLYFNMAYHNTFRQRLIWSYTLLPSSSSHVKGRGGRPLKF